MSQRVHAKRGFDGTAYGEFLGGWRGIVYRYRAFVEATGTLLSQLQMLADPARNETTEDRYEQDDAIYSRLVAGMSAIECCTYAAYFVAVLADPSLAVTVEGRKSIGPNHVREKFKNHWSASAFFTAIDALLNGGRWDDWKAARNILTHRISPPRRIADIDTIELEKDSSSLVIVELTPTAVNSDRKWLAGHLQGLIHGLDDFAANYL